MARGFYVGRGGAWQMRPNESEGAKSDNKYLLDRQAANVAYSLVDIIREDNMIYRPRPIISYLAIDRRVK